MVGSLRIYAEDIPKDILGNVASDGGEITTWDIFMQILC